MIRLILAVAVGGAAGTLLRFATGTWIAANWPQHFSLGTFLVNIVGCLLIGLLYGFFCSARTADRIARRSARRFPWGPDDVFFLFLDTLRLLENGQLPLALGYAALSVFGGLLATWVGLSLTKL